MTPPKHPKSAPKAAPGAKGTKRHSRNHTAKVLLVDGHSLAFRAFYALPPELRTTSGQMTNAVFGFTSMLIKAIQEMRTRHIAVVFDKGAPVERLAIRPEYKAQRTAPPDEFRQQLGLIHEVLTVLNVPIFEIENTEADDIIAVLASKLGEVGHEVIVVTADRDFFQIVDENVKILMNRRGISETVLYDVEGVEGRFGFGPERYLEYAALRGDPSDNIEGVAGVGEKTAAKLVQTYGTLEEVFENLDSLQPRVKTNLGEAKERLLENREFFRFRGEEELGSEAVSLLSNISLDDIRMKDWDLPVIRRLFDALEFKTLYDRLTAEVKEMPASETFDATSEEILDTKGLEALATSLASQDRIVVRVGGSTKDPRAAPEWMAFAVGTSEGGISGRVLRLTKTLDADDVSRVLSPALSEGRIVTHGSKDLRLRLWAMGIETGEIAMDTEIAAYLCDPARGSYPLKDLARQYLGRELVLIEEAGEGQQSLTLAQDEKDPGADTSLLGLEAAAVAELAYVLAKELGERGASDLFESLELPLADVLAKLELTGIKIDVAYLQEMGHVMASELQAIEEKIYDLAGGPFNINSPPQLRTVLYDRLGLRPTKKTKTGFSTDATVLESLREEHPIVEAILIYREKSKLRSTYIDALPPLVDKETSRLHCRFNQTTTSTGRLSSDSPNLQNIPIRTAEGKQIRRAFIADQSKSLLVADYSQIELRVLAHMSEDVELTSAFSRGEDIHRRSIAKALGIPEDQVSPELRSIGKMVSFGVTYGMGPFGLSQRLHIPVEQARTYIDGFFALYPRVREYLDEVVAKATAEGFTTTLLGRRRYLPELQSRNVRVRNLGERMALNAPIQGTAADIMKLAMVRADRAVERTKARMVLTVHDELVFEVFSADVEATAETVREAMEGAVELSVPLKTDVYWGPNWAEAKH